MKTRLSALAAAVSSLSMLTACGGGGGGGSGEVPEFTPVPRPVYTAAAGHWDGMIGTRTASATISNEGSLWVVYSSLGGSDPVGFYAAAVSDNDAGEARGSNLKQFSFEGDIVRDGTVVVSYSRAEGGNTASTTLDIDFNGLTGNQYSVDMHTSVFFPAASGSLNMIGFRGVYDSDTGVGNWTGTTTIPGFNTTMHYTQTFFMPPAGKDEAPLGNFPLSPGVYAAEDWPPGYGWLDQLDSNTCTDNTGSACAGLATPLSGAFFNTVGTTDTDYKTPVGFMPVDGWTGTWTLQVYKYESPSDPNHFYPMYFSVALHALPVGASILSTSLNATFDTAYNDLPYLTNILGSYVNGTAGVGNTTYPSDTSLQVVEDTSTGANISRGTADAVFSGTTTATGCTYSGKMVGSSKGNFYIVNDLSFSGGSCPYTGQVFKGIATLLSGELTLTAVNEDRDMGFMIVADKAP